MPHIQINNAEFYYELHGDPTKQPLVLINGLTRDHNAWSKMLPELTQDFYILIFDNQGVGQTKDQGAAFSVETMADDTMMLIEALKLEKPCVAGHSLGGAIAQVIAQKHVDKIYKLALCNTFIKIRPQAEEAFHKILLMRQSGVAETEIMDSLIPWVFSKSFITPEVRAYIEQMNQSNPYPQSIEDYQRQLKAVCQFDSKNWVRHIHMPVLVIGSEEDVTATPEQARELAACIPNAKLEFLPGAHVSYAEQPVLFVQKLKAFFL